MEQTSKTPLVIGIVIVAAIVIMVLWVAMQNQATAPTPVETPQTSATPVVQGDIPTDISISAKDISDLALNQDIASIGTQISGLGQDSATVAAGLNTAAEPQP